MIFKLNTTLEHVALAMLREAKEEAEKLMLYTIREHPDPEVSLIKLVEEDEFAILIKNINQLPEYFESAMHDIVMKTLHAPLYKLYIKVAEEEDGAFEFFSDAANLLKNEKLDATVHVDEGIYVYIVTACLEEFNSAVEHLKDIAWCI